MHRVVAGFILAFAVALTFLLLPTSAWAQEDEFAIRWWYERYEALGQNNPKWDGLVLQGIRLWYGKTPTDAIEPIGKAMKLGCKSPVLRYIYANALVSKKEYGQILTVLNEGLQNLTGNDEETSLIRAHLLTAKGEQYERMGQYEDAKKELDAASAIDTGPYKGIHDRASNGATRCKEILRLKDVSIPKRAGKDQIRAYCKEVLSGAPYLDYNIEDPYVEKLVAIGPENIDVLLALNLQSAENGYLHVLHAVRDLARPEDKQLILKWLPRNHRLVEVVLKQGWEADAKPILMQVLSQNPMYLPSEWISAVASLKDPGTYPSLYTYFVKNPEVYESLKDLPGFKVKEAAEEIWTSLEYWADPRAPSYVRNLSVCVDAGIAAALAVTVDYLDAKWDETFFKGTPRDLVLKYTNVSGTNDELRAWHRKHRDVLVFDEQAKKFIAPKDAIAPAEPPERTIEYRKADLLRTVFKIREKYDDSDPAFTKALREGIDLYKEIPISKLGNRPLQVRLSAHGEGIDAVKFRAPSGKKMDMLWSFTEPPTAYFWYIVPAKGEVKGGFTNWYQSESWSGEGTSTFQYLAADYFTPGEEYIIWIEVEDRAPTRMQITIKFVPPGSVKNELDALKNALKPPDQEDMPDE